MINSVLLIIMGEGRFEDFQPFMCSSDVPVSQNFMQSCDFQMLYRSESFCRSLDSTMGYIKTETHYKDLHH